MAQRGNRGIGKLAKVLDQRMNEHSGEGLTFDFGEIKGDYSLLANTFPVPIPKGDYSVCRLITGISIGISGGAHDGHSMGSGSHNHSAVIPKLKPGDRVLLVWVQEEPVVIDVIEKASSL